MRQPHLLLTLSAVLVLGACQRRGSTAEQSPTQSTAASSVAAPSVPVSSSSAPASAALQQRDTAPSSSKEPSGNGHAFSAGIVDYKASPRGAALLTDVRSARHPGFDRVVFELASDALPSYHLEYIDKPVRRCGSGDVATIAGDGWLEVRFEPANAHTPSGAPTILDRDQQPSLKVVKELVQTCDFEAQVVWVLGVASPNKYRVLTLDAPLRLVVDVQH